MIFGSFPQLILGIFIMQGLQIQELGNVISTVTSFVCVIFAFGDFLAYNVYDEDGSFVYTIFAMMSTFIDSLFRALFFAYLASVFKLYSLFILVSYFLMMLIAICIKKRKEGKCSLKGQDIFGTMVSFPCSALEHSDTNYSFR